MGAARGAVRRKGRETGRGRVLVELSGEFDVHDLGLLRETLDGASSSSLPVEADLSSVTFLDLRCARELVARSRLCGGRVMLRHPSWQAASSFEALGAGAGILCQRENRQGAGRVSSRTPVYAG